MELHRAIFTMRYVFLAMFSAQTREIIKSRDAQSGIRGHTEALGDEEWGVGSPFMQIATRDARALIYGQIQVLNPFVTKTTDAARILQMHEYYFTGWTLNGIYNA